MADDLEIDVKSCGSITLKKRQPDKGGEPDECYYLSPPPEIKTKVDIDLETDPAPNLVVEIDISSGSLAKDKLYVAYGIPEIWWYRDTTGTFEILQLTNEAYIPTSHSAALPGVQITDVQQVLKNYETVGERHAITLCRKAIRERQSQ